MTQIEFSEEFTEWLKDLRDEIARKKIRARLAYLEMGNPGDAKLLKEKSSIGVRELRIDHGPGYRVYYFWPDRSVVAVLYGGNKNTQNQDVKVATMLARTRKGKQK